MKAADLYTQYEFRASPAEKGPGHPILLSDDGSMSSWAYAFLRQLLPLNDKQHSQIISFFDLKKNDKPKKGAFI